jgi:tetratricopeptide (TPR) repeat protein
LKRASGDYVMWLDADDRLTPENVVRLRTQLTQLDGKPRAYLMNTACWTEFSCEGHTLITHPRLFHRGAGLAWQGRVHEQLRATRDDVHVEAVFSEVRIDHHGYAEQAMQQRKLQRNVRLLRMDYAVDPDDVSTLLHLGLTYYQLRRWEEARKYLSRLLEIAPQVNEHLRQVHGSLAHIAMLEGNLAEALSALEQGLASFPADEYLLFLKAECLYDLDRYDDAINTLIQIVAGPERPMYQGGTPGDIRMRLAPRKLADSLRLKRQYAPAESLLRSLVERFPQDTHSWHLLGRVYLDTAQRDKLLKVVERLNTCPQGEVFGHLLMALWHLNRNELEAAGERVESMITLAPRMAGARILRLDLLMRGDAPLGHRMQACRDVLRMQPGNLEARRALEMMEAEERSLVSGAVVFSGGPAAGSVAAAK